MDVGSLSKTHDNSLDASLPYPVSSTCFASGLEPSCGRASWAERLVLTAEGPYCTARSSAILWLGVAFPSPEGLLLTKTLSGGWEKPVTKTWSMTKKLSRRDKLQALSDPEKREPRNPSRGSRAAGRVSLRPLFSQGARSRASSAGR